MTILPSFAADFGHRSWQEAFEPDELAGGPSPWGNSRYQAFKHCPYYYWWTYIRRMTPELYDSYMEIGGLWHEVRARVGNTYLAGTDPDGLPIGGTIKDIHQACIAVGWEIINRAEDVVPGIAGKVRHMYESWLPLRGPGAPGCDLATLYGVEEVWQVSEPVPYSARIDQWHWIGGPVIKEVKTAGRRDTALIESYRMDSQFLGHQWLWKKTMQRRWGKLESYHVDLITSTKDPYVGPETVAIREDLIRDWLKETRYLYAQMIQCEMSGHWPRRRTWRCTRGNRPCGLYDHCASNGKYNVGWRRKRKGEY